MDGYDSSGFGYRVHPIQGTVKFHYGTDFAADNGDSVFAFADGYVYAAGESDSYGKYLILTHEGSNGVKFVPDNGHRHNTAWKWISIYPQAKMMRKGTDTV